MNVETSKITMENLASFCKRRGFIFQSSEIYGGINGFWDYGPLGCELKRNIRDAWWNDTVRRREDVVGLDASIIMHPKVWEASGHVGGFADPMVDCRNCRHRFRADQICEEFGESLISEGTGFRLPENVRCPHCGSAELTEPRSFNLMFKTYVGPVEDASAIAYLRPETAQGIFAQFQNVLSVARRKVPFGIAQVGKAFRNEINPRNFTFRSREFEQMELEYFVKPGSDAEWHAYWVDARMRWYNGIGLPAEHLTRYDYAADELAHYASACVDIMYEFPFGVQELEGIAARGDFDLSCHQKHSGKSMEYFDAESGERYLPHVIEPSAGVDRIALAVLCEAFTTEWAPTKAGAGEVLPAEPGKNPPPGYEIRTTMRLHPRVAPIKVAVLPLVKNKPPLVEKARALYERLKENFACFYDQTGAVGRRYRRQDEAGTPFCLTVDFETLENDTVTLRQRDTMEQERLSIDEVESVLRSAIA